MERFTAIYLQEQVDATKIDRVGRHILLFYRYFDVMDDCDDL